MAWEEFPQLCLNFQKAEKYNIGKCWEDLAFCEEWWVGQYHVPLSALWSTTASQWPVHQQECPPVNVLHVTQTAARLMYYMTGTDRRPSNHGGSSLMLLLPEAAGE